MTSLPMLLALAVFGGPDAAKSADGSPAAVSTIDLPRLRELLYSRREPQEQSQAALLLVQSPSAEAMKLILEGLRRWDRPDVFQALAAAIRTRRDHRFADALLKALTSEQTSIRQAAVETLARLDHTITTRRLIMIADDTFASLTARQAAVVTLGRSMHRSAVLPLIGLLAGDSPGVRQSASGALEELTGQTFGTDPGRWNLWWQQHKDLSEEEWLVARAAYFADRSRRLQQDLQQAETNILQLHETLYAKTPAADRPNHFALLAQSEYPAVRGKAVTWLVDMLPTATAVEKRRLADLLLQLSDDGVEDVQRQAVLAMEKVDDPHVFERLLALLKTGSIPVRSAAARSLGRYHPSKTNPNTDHYAKALKALEDALGDASLAVVAEAAESLGSMGMPEAAPIVAGLLRHPADPVREAAARALEQIADVSVLTALHKGLDDPAPGVRFSLVGALGKVGGSAKLSTEHKTAIVKRMETSLLGDGDPGVRSRAATFIGVLGSATELPVLWQRVTATEDNRVQLRAWTGMIEILSRSLDWNLVSQWDQTLAAQKDPSRRAELLIEIRNRWLKLETSRPDMDPITGALIQAQLAQRKWNLALPLAAEMAKNAPSDSELKKRLRWLHVAGTQAVDDRKPADALQMLKDIEPLLARSGELAVEFDLLRQRVHKAMEN